MEGVILDPLLGLSLVLVSIGKAEGWMWVYIEVDVDVPFAPIIAQSRNTGQMEA